MSRLPPPTGSPFGGGSASATLRRLLPYLWPEPGALRFRIYLALGLIVAAKLSTVAVPLAYKKAVDSVSDPVELAIALPVGLLVAYGMVRVMSSLVSELSEVVFSRVAQNAMHTVGLETFHHLHRLSLRFHLERQTGALSRVLVRGTSGIEGLLRFCLFYVAPTCLEMALVCAVLWRLFDARFMLATVATMAVYIAYTLLVTRWRTKFHYQVIEAESDAGTKVVDSLLNYETVKYFGNEDHEASRYDTALTAYEKAQLKSARSMSQLNFGQAAIIAMGLTAVMLMAASGVADGSLSVGDFVMVNAYLVQLYVPLHYLGHSYRVLRQALVDVESMFTLLEVNAEVDDSPDAQPLVVDRGAVEFDHVDFGYDSRRPILRDVSFTVPAGHTVAIVGPSGAGKSTIMRLLFRFYDVDGGGIRIDGQDLRAVTQSSLRAAIGIVPQDTVLFNDSIFYNVAYGRPDATPSQVEEAARLAQIHDFIMRLPDGYQTRVGERGLKLSGGERQRVAIARTILKGPRLLLFDEATSALDTRTERGIQESLKQISTGLTTIVIAHRLSTIVDADEIVVLDEGRVVERGDHAALLAKGGLYARMWEHQRDSWDAADALAEDLDDFAGEPLGA